jgi:hypothetical protein
MIVTSVDPYNLRGGKRRKDEISLQMQSRAYLNSTFKLGREHKYCFELVQGVENKSCTSSSHKQYRNKQYVKQENNELQ